MLANGITLGFKTSSAEGSYTDLPLLKEVPQIGADAELVENTPLSAKNRRYEQGIGTLPELEFIFIYENSATSAYRLMRTHADNKAKLYFEETLSDGTTFTFEAIPSIKLNGGGVNDPIDMVLTLAVQSDIDVTDPVG